jgi:hypothetical protein
MRAFVQLRRFLSVNKELGQKLAQLERKIGAHDEQIRAIFNLMGEPALSFSAHPIGGTWHLTRWARVSVLGLFETEINNLWLSN